MTSPIAGQEPAFRTRVDGPLVRDGHLPVDLLNRLSRHLQSAVQAIAEVAARADAKDPKDRASARRVSRLSVVAVRPGSVLVEFDFTVHSDEDWVRNLRQEAARGLIRGVNELIDHTYLPVGWSPDTLKPIRGLVKMLDHDLSELVIEAPGLVREQSARINEELAPRLNLMIGRYEQLGAADYARSLGAPAPSRRRASPTLPLFESGDPKLSDDLTGEFGSESDADDSA